MTRRIAFEQWRDDARRRFKNASSVAEIWAYMELQVITRRWIQRMPREPRVNTCKSG
jgi:hypothetical protein